ncbi:MAG: hypothetical protein GDA44_04940 [Prochloron sp. SP5CPC1]|nr:hypothetical protein [Candidatus Paraprochloron terpiosi SP5CPC1]
MTVYMMMGNGYVERVFQALLILAEKVRFSQFHMLELGDISASKLTGRLG